MDTLTCHDDSELSRVLEVHVREGACHVCIHLVEVLNSHGPEVGVVTIVDLEKSGTVKSGTVVKRVL